ncbi:MAG TPA: polysaccharide biosynthesis tyrosine autokinase, partial [Abditibacteriaceae bacterium]
MNDPNMAPPPPGSSQSSGQSRSQGNRAYTSDIVAPVGARANAGGAAPFVLWASEPERRNSIEFADIAAVLQRRRWTILLTFLVVAGLSALYLLLTPPVYEARAYLQARVPEGENDLLAQALGPSQPRSLQTQVAIVQNPIIARDAINTYFPMDKRGDLHDYGFVVADSVPATDLIEIRAQARTAEDAENLANSVGAHYVKFSQNNNRQGTVGTRAYVQNQAIAAKAKLNKAQRALRDYKQRNGVFNLTREADALVEQSQRFEQSWRDARAQKAASIAQLAETRNVSREVPPAKIVPVEIRRRPEVESLKMELARLEAERIRLLQEFTPGSDRVIQINGQIEDLRTRLRNQAQTETASWRVEFSPVKQIAQQDVARLRGQIWALEAQGTAYKNSLRDTRQRLAALPERELRLSQLTLDVTALQSTYDQLNERLQALRISEHARVASAEVVFPAQDKSAKKIRPNIPRTIALALMAGLVLALGLAALIDQLDDRLHSDREATQTTHLPVLANIPYLDRAAGSSLYEPTAAPTLLLETFQLLATNIEFSAVDDAISVIAVASGLPSEGKSTSALNLAIAAALGGRRVILVDCDLRRPTQHRLCNLPNQVGLSNVLTGAHSLQEALQESDVNGLRILTGGPTPPNPIRLLKSRSAAQIIADLRTQADFIVLDTPPVLALADAQVVTALADATLLVISSRDTGRRDVTRALGLLAQSGT